MKKILLVLALATFAAPTSAANTLRATVNGMVCAFCAQGIEKRISKMDATKAVFVDLKNKTVAVEAREGKVLSEKAIVHEIVEAGYDVIRMEAVSMSVAEMKARLKAKK